MEAFFEFEKPIASMEKKLFDLRDLARQEGVDFGKEISVLEKKVAKLIDETYSRLSPWQRIQLSRHPSRPYARDYIDALFPDFMELQGDRTFGDDQALLGGVATWPPVSPRPAASTTAPTGTNGSGKKSSPAPSTPAGELPAFPRHGDRFPIMILGHQKGRNTKQKMERNFGMARPEGYRKAVRLMKVAERARMPVLTLIDTPGAYPGLDAEERGQSQAIAESIEEMFRLTVPVATVVIGEGGSGGALAIGIANLVLMQEYSYYSVISPESCAAILWSDSGLAERAADKLKISANDLLRLGVIDSIVKEPLGGAHRDWPQAAELLRESLLKHWEPMLKTIHKRGSPAARKVALDRIEKFRLIGQSALDHAPVQSGA